MYLYQSRTFGTIQLAEQINEFPIGYTWNYPEYFTGCSFRLKLFHSNMQLYNCRFFPYILHSSAENSDMTHFPFWLG